MEEMRYLTFALGKGRLAKKTLELFEQIGITCEEMKDKDTFFPCEGTGCADIC